MRLRYVGQRANLLVSNWYDIIDYDIILKITNNKYNIQEKNILKNIFNIWFFKST